MGTRQAPKMLQFDIMFGYLYDNEQTTPNFFIYILFSIEMWAENSKLETLSILI